MADDPDALRARADQCRRLAKGVSTNELARALGTMAEDYDRQADAADEDRAASEPPRDIPPAPEH